MARKKGKLPPPVVQPPYELEYGADTLEIKSGDGGVLLVDALLATGETVQAAANLCERAGYKVISLVVLLHLRLVNHFEWRSHSVPSAFQYG